MDTQLDNSMEDNELVPVAIQIILFAGDARLDADAALDLVKTKDFTGAREKINSARENIRKAHMAQTDIIQNEAAGKAYQLCLMFVHAQDTLMTVYSEVKLAEKLIDLFESFLEEVKK